MVIEDYIKFEYKCTST